MPRLRLPALLALSLALVLSMGTVLAQNFAVIGNPNATTRSAITGWVNSNNSTSANTRSIMKIGADEMRRAGFFGGPILELAFLKFDSTATPPANLQLDVFMGQLPAADSLYNNTTNTWAIESATAPTQVYSNAASVFPGDKGWWTMRLSQPYIWDGVSTLVIATEYRRPSTYTPAINWVTNTTTGRNKLMANYSATALPTSLTRSTSRAVCRLTWGYLPGLGAAVAGFTSPVGNPLAGNLPITVNVRNIHQDPITSVGLASSINGVPGPTFTYSGNLAGQGGLASVTIGNHTYAPGTNVTRVWITSVNGAPSGFASDDTAQTTNFFCSTVLSGVYTLDNRQPATATNFRSLSDVASAINECGVGGPITLNVVPGSGPYENARFNITRSGAFSATNTLTINGNNAIFRGEGTATVANGDGVFTIRNNGFVTIKKVHVEINNTATGAFGIAFYGANLPNITVDSCLLVSAPRSTGQTSFLGIYAAVGPAATPAVGGIYPNITITNNTIRGFYHGIGVGFDTLAAQTPGTISGNTLVDFGLTGIYVTRASEIRIERNTIYRTTAVNTTAPVGINLAAFTRNVLVNANKIYNLAGNGPSFPTTMTAINVAGNARVDKPLVITNNSIGPFTHTTGATVNGILASARAFVNILHNSFAMDGPVGTGVATTYCIDFGTGANTLATVRNNIFSYNRGGTGVKAGIRGNFASRCVVSDNVFFVDTTITNRGIVSSNGALVASFNDYRQSAWGTNSLFENPDYTSPSIGDLEPNNSAIENRAAAIGVLTDIRGNTRSTTTPDFGAYEFSLAGTCRRVADLRWVNNVSTTVRVRWTLRAGVTPTNTELKWGAQGFDIATGGTTIPVPAGRDSVDIQGAVPGTFVDVYVRRLCTDGTGNSGWVGPLTILVPLLNDEPCGAIELPLGSVCNFTASTNVGATFSNAAGLAYPGCALATTPDDVWFKFTTAASGVGSTDVVIANAGFSVGQIRVASAASCSGPFTQVACGVRNPAQVANLIVRNLTPSTTYYVMLAGDINDDLQETFSICVSGDIANSLNNGLAAKPVVAMPNPARGTVKLVGDLVQQGSTVSFYNAQGRMVQSTVLNSAEDALNISALPAGLYKVRVQNGTSTETTSVVVE